MIPFVEAKEKWKMPSPAPDAWCNASNGPLPSGDEFPTLRSNGKESKQITENGENVVANIASADSKVIGLIESITLDGKLENISSVIQNLQEHRLEIAKAISTQALSIKSRHSVTASVWLAFGLVLAIGSELIPALVELIPALVIDSPESLKVTLSSVWVVAIIGLTIAAVATTYLFKSYFLNYKKKYGQLPETEALLQEYLTVCEEIKTNNEILKEYDASP